MSETEPAAGRERPDPPAPEDLDPLVEAVAAGSELVRVYQRRWKPRTFNPTAAEGRFRPVRDDLGGIVPTAYAASDSETALAETLLRGVEALAGGARPRLYASRVAGHSLVRLRVTRDLRLARLHGLGLQRLGVLRTDLIDAWPADHDYTSAWAQALWDSPTELDGLEWTSRQNDSGRAMVLWEGPVEPERGLEVVDDPVSLDSGDGLELVRDAALRAGFTFAG